MSYLNFKLYKLEPQDLYYLLSLKQVEGIIIPEDTLLRFSEQELIKSIKGKKGDSEDSKLRLSDKGKQLLVDLGEAPVLEEDEKIFNWLKNHYVKLGKDIGNGAKTKRHIRDFRLKSGIEKNNLLRLVLAFLKENEERSNKLEYVFYYPKTAFATRFDLEESWLWGFYIKNKDNIEKTFE